MNINDVMDRVHASTLQVVALALDAAVDHPDLDVTEKLYEGLLLEASHRMRARIGAHLPAYPEALDRVVVKFTEKRK